MNTTYSKQCDFTEAKLTSNLLNALHKVVTNNTWVIVGMCHFKPQYFSGVSVGQNLKT